MLELAIHFGYHRPLRPMQQTGPPLWTVLATYPSPVFRTLPVIKSQGKNGFRRRVFYSFFYVVHLRTALVGTPAAGVLAPGQFAWLKLVDRPLWYALHSLGFETEGYGRYLHPNAWIEAAGARDHWAAECFAGRAIIFPNIERAMDAIARMTRETKDADAQPESEDDTQALDRATSLAQSVVNTAPAAKTAPGPA